MPVGYRYGTPQPRDIECLRRSILATAARNGHQVEELELAWRFQEDADATRFSLAWRDADGLERTACIWIDEAAVREKYAREVFDDKVARIFPPPPPLPPVFLDAGAGI